MATLINTAMLITAASGDRVPSPNEKAVANAGRVETPFVLVPNLDAFLSALRQIRNDVSAVAKIVGDDDVDICQGQRTTPWSLRSIGIRSTVWTAFT